MRVPILIICLLLLFIPRAVHSQSVGPDNFEPNNDVDHAQPINCCTSLNLTLDSSTDEDWFKFTLGDDQIVRITTGYPNTNLGISASLHAFNGTDEIIFDSIDEIALHEGDYFLRIYSPGQLIGNYTLNFEYYLSPDNWEPNDNAQEAVLLSPNMFGSIHTPFDQDWFFFGITNISQIHIEVSAPQISLFDQDLNLLTKDQFEVHNDRLVDPSVLITLDAGTYYLVVSVTDSGQGSYVDEGYEISVFTVQATTVDYISYSEYTAPSSTDTQTRFKVGPTHLDFEMLSLFMLIILLRRRK